MVASLLKIVSTGIQDERLQPPKEQPNLDAFLKVIVKAGRYATQWARIDFDTAPNFGQSAVARLPTQGEMIGRVFLVTKMPDIQTAQLNARNTPIPIKITHLQYTCPIPVYYSASYIQIFLQPILQRYQLAKDEELVAYTNYKIQLDIMNINNLLPVINALKNVLNAVITEYTQTRSVLLDINTIYTNMNLYNDISGTDFTDYPSQLLILGRPTGVIVSLYDSIYGAEPYSGLLNNLFSMLDDIDNSDIQPVLDTITGSIDTTQFTILNDPSNAISNLTTVLFISNTNIVTLNNYITILNGYLVILNNNLPINIDDNDPNSIVSIFNSVVSIYNNIDQYANNTEYNNILTNFITPYSSIDISSQITALDYLLLILLANTSISDNYNGYYNTSFGQASLTDWTQESTLTNRLKTNINNLHSYLQSNDIGDGGILRNAMNTLNSVYNGLYINNPQFTPYDNFGGPGLAGGLYSAYQVAYSQVEILNNTNNPEDPYGIIRDKLYTIKGNLTNLNTNYNGTGSYNISNPGSDDYSYDAEVNITNLNKIISGDNQNLNNVGINTLVQHIQDLINYLNTYTPPYEPSDYNYFISNIDNDISSFGSYTIFDSSFSSLLSQIRNDANALNAGVLQSDMDSLNTYKTTYEGYLTRYSNIAGIIDELYNNIRSLQDTLDYIPMPNISYHITTIISNIYEPQMSNKYILGDLSSYISTIDSDILTVQPFFPYDLSVVNPSWVTITNDNFTLVNIHNSAPPLLLSDYNDTIYFMRNYYNSVLSIKNTLSSMIPLNPGNYSINPTIPAAYSTALYTYEHPINTPAVTNTLAIYTAKSLITAAIFSVIFNIQSYYITNSPTLNTPPPPFKETKLNDLIEGKQYSLNFTIPYNPTLHVLLPTDPNFNSNPPPVFTQCIFSIFITDRQLGGADILNLPNSYTWPLDPSLINGTYGTQVTLPPISGFPTGTFAQWSNSPTYGSGLNYNLQLYNNPNVVNLPTFTYTAISSRAYITYGIYSYTRSPVTVTLTPLTTLTYYPFFDGDPNGAYRVSFAGPRFGWTNSLGHALINQASVNIGGVLMDTIPGNLMEVLDEFQTPLEKVSETNRQLCRDPSNFTSSSFGMDSTPQEVITHLPFWFSRGDPGCLLPIDALNVDEVRITVQFNPVTSLYYTDSRLVDTSGAIIQTNIPGGSLWPMANSDFYYCYPSGTPIPNMEPPLYNGLRNFSKYPGVSMTNVLKMVESYLLVEYIYLDKPEANRFRVADIQVPIVQHYLFEPEDNQNNNYARMGLVIPNPTRDLFFYCQRYTAPGYNAPFLGTRDLSNTLVPYAPWWPDSRGLDDHYYGNIRSGFSTRNSEPIRWLSLDYAETLNRYSTENVALFRSLIPSIEQRKAPFINRYYYNIPLGTQNGFTPFSMPMGQANLDKVLRLNLSLGFHGKSGILSADYVDRYNTYVFAETYNIFRVYGGRGTLMFAY